MLWQNFWTIINSPTDLKKKIRGITSFFLHVCTHGHAKDISDYTMLIEKNPRYAEAYNNRVVAYYYKKEYDKAWEDVHKAEELGLQVPPELLELLRQATGR